VVEEKDTHKVLGIYLTSLFICYLCSSTHLTSWLVHVELQQSNLARDAHTVKDAVPMPVVPYNNARHGGEDLLFASSTFTTNFIGQHQLVNFLTWQKELLKEFKHESICGIGASVQKYHKL
jgi:hypothetical protein